MGKGRRTAAKATPMTPKELAARVRRLKPAEPMRGHLAQWLEEYSQPGYYKRKVFDHSARFAYNHLQNPDWILWLAGAVGTPRFALAKARAAAGLSQGNLGAEAAAVRAVLPWELVQALLLARQER